MSDDSNLAEDDRAIAATVPPLAEIRALMVRNAEESRLLRSLYRLSRRIHEFASEGDRDGN